MTEIFGAGRAAANCREDPADARAAALELMTRALGHLDRDPGIPPVMGAYLQAAIDMLWASMPSDRPSVRLH